MISNKEVRHIAALARLQLSKKEEKEMTGQLHTILEYMHQLQELNTEDIPPTVHAVEIANVWREDTPSPSLEQEEALKNAPQHNGEFFIVPRVLGD